ncbi:4166_t:CDS:2 [Entrophospora sp. SA101]|nr:4166_t:CDS:2 [Entrophospora sp. SA101]
MDILPFFTGSVPKTSLLEQVPRLVKNRPNTDSKITVLKTDVGIKIEQYKLIVEAAHEIWKSIDSCLKSEEILLS